MTEQPHSVHQPLPKSQPPKGKEGMILAIVAIVMAVAVILVVFLYVMGNSGPEGAINNFVSKANSDDYEGAVGHTIHVFTGEADDFVQMLELGIHPGDEVFIDVHSIEMIYDVNMDLAFVDYWSDSEEPYGVIVTDMAEISCDIGIRTADGEVEGDDITMQCFKIDGRWYISLDS